MTMKRGRSQSSADEAPPTKRLNSETASDNGDQELNSIEDASALATAVPNASIITESNEAIAEPTDVEVEDHEQEVETMESEVPTILDNTQQTQNVSAVVPAVGLMVVAPEFTVVHDSWEDFEEALRAYATATYQLYVIRSTTSVKRRNLKIAESAAKGDASGLVKKGLELGVEHSSNAVEEAPERTLIPEQFQWYSKSLKCTHGWKDRHRGTGKRGSGVVRSTSCPAKMCVTLQHRGTGSGDWKVVVTKHVRTHNHQLSKELYLYYTENRRIYDPELLAVVGEESIVATEIGTSSNNLANAHLASLIDQANQRAGAFRVMTSGEDGAAQIQQSASSMAFIVSELSTSSTGSNTAPNGRASNQLVPLSESSSGNFVIRPRITAGAMSVATPPVGTLILTPGTIPSEAMDGGGFCVPRVSVKLHPSWDAFHDYIAQYSFDTAQVFRTRSTVSVLARNAKILASMAAKAGVDNHSIASYASYSAATPTSRLIPEEYKWFSKLLICTYGWKRRARIKGPRINNDHDGGGPCPAMLLARMERNVDGEWNVVINRQVQEHNHKLNGHAEEMDDNNHEAIAPAEDVSGEFVTASTGASIPAHMSHSVDTAAHLESETIATEASIGDLAAQPTEHREIVVRVPKLQSVFKSWDDFHASLKHYSDATYQLYRTRTTSSAEGRNKKIAQMKRSGDDGNDGISESTSDPDLSGVNVARKIPESWRWYSKTLTCTHGWKERNRGTGKRNALGVRSTACPVKICATVQYVAPTSRLASDVEYVEKDEVSENCWRVVVTKHVVDHNHNLSRELYQHYCENRRIYDRELLAIDASSEGAVVKRKVYRSPDHVTTGNEHSSAQSGDCQMAFQPPVLSAQLEAMPAEDGVHAQFFGNMVGIGGNATADMQQPASAISTSVVGMTQTMVPSVVLLPYSAPSFYGQNLRSPAQHQRQQQQQQEEQQQQHDDSVQDHTVFAGNRTATQTRETEGTEGVATLAAIAATPASIPRRNNAGIASSSASSHSMIAGLCRVHGTIAGHSVPKNSAENASAAQCTCLRNAGGGSYIAIVPASEPLAPAETSFDADDDTMLYAEDTDGVWQPASNVEIEKVTNENGEMIWRVPRLVRRYPTWDAFHKCLDAYSAATFQLYRVRTTYSVKSRNTRLRQLAASRGLTVREADDGGTNSREDTEREGAHGLSRAHLVPEQYEWYSKTFLCTHGWKRRSRGSGQRVSHNVRATECPAKVCATLQRTDGATNWSIVVTKHLTEHNHEISEAIYQQYSEVRRVKDPEVLIQAEQLWRGGATRRRVFEFLKDRSPNQVILMKDVHNLVQRWQSQERRPRQDHQQDEEEDIQEEQEQSSQLATVVSSTGSHDDSSWLNQVGYVVSMSSAFFQGGDFVELLSAQGKSPAAAWKLQGKISKTFEKGIKGNTFQLEGNSETKMQLPKTASSSLGLAQRFVVLQLLVPFIRSFSVEICFSDFQKVRRRFVVASAFRETARTALHVQLPLSTAGVPRDQWINLVFDLLSLSEVHFPGTGYRSMESICVGGSCRLKRIFTMKDAPAPSRGSQVVQHADIRDIPRQFVFSATQRGVSGALPLPTLYFTMQKASGAHEVPIVTSTIKGETLKSSRRSQTAPVKAQTKVAKGTRTGRPASEMHQRKMTHPESASHTAASSTKTVGREPQRLRTPVRVSTTGSKLRQPQSRLCKVVVSKQPSVLQQTELTGIAVGVSSPSRALDEENIPEVQENDLRISLSPVRASRSGLAKQQEETRSADTPSQTECKSPSWDQNQGSVLSNLLSSSTDGVQQQRMQSQSLRQSILGEIQQKLSSLEDEDEREDQRNRELFLRHTSLHSGEWHLQQLRDEDLHSDDGALVSDDESEHVQLSSSWRREMNDSNTNVMVSSTEMKQRLNQEVIPPRISRSTTDKATIFSFSSSVEQKTQSTLKSTARLFDFDSLLQDEKSSTPLLDKEQARSSIRSELHGHPCADVQNESTVMDTEYDADDLELDKLLAAKRSARQLTPQSQVTCLTGNDVLPKEKESISAISNDDNDLRDEEQLSGDRVEDERGDWVVVENNIEGNGHEEASNYNCTDQEKEWHLRPSGILEEESGLGSGNEDDALSIDLTSELSASGRNFHDLEDEGDLESSVSPTTPEITDKHKPESDRESSDADDDSSFDFEDLVEDAESSDERTEEGENRADYGDTLKKPISAMAGQPKELTLKPSSSPPRNQTTHEHRELPTELGSLKSPLVDYPSPTGARSKLLHKSSSERPCEPSHPVELSSSFSSRRLQTLLESTDWTAELNAQANPSHVSGNPTPPFARSSDRRLKNAGSSDPKTPVSKARPLSRSQTASTSSIELVYDPLLRCYYDPIANKYYALAE